MPPAGSNRTQKDVYMFTPSPNFQKVLASLTLCFVVTSAYSEDLTPELPKKKKAAPAEGTANLVKDETNASPRERGRILVKRNPIASEYQVFGDVGSSAGADADAEGVDFRAFFPRSTPLVATRDSLQLGYSISYNDQSSIGKSGYQLNFVKKLGDEERWAIAGQYRSSASDRLIEHYESVWQETDDGNHVLDRPRISFDKIYTRNDVASAQIGYKLNERNTLYYKTQYQDYFDNSYRNRLELQFANADIVDGSVTIASDGSITEANFTDARTRRYFGDTDNSRKRQHHTIGGTFKGDDWNVDYSLYLQKWNLDTNWFNWNFTERGLDAGYSIKDPYKPDIIEGDNFDMLNMEQSNFSNLRVHDTHTRDRDKAFRIDGERSIDLLDQEYWIQTGLLHREKQRDKWEDRTVYGANSADNFTLADVGYDNDGFPVLDGTYILQPGLDPVAGKELFYDQPEYFPENEYRSIVESAQQSFTAEESVTSAYFLVTKDWGEWLAEVGGRFEHTVTETRGTVAIPESVNDPEEGELIDVVMDPSSGENTIIKNLYSSNDYNNFVPSTEVTFKANKNNTFKASWFQLLMRPQYINIVDYRRISVPTQNISEGNPSLSPTEIDKLRLAWTHENQAIGSFSAEVYQINIENFFYGSVSNETILENGVPTIYRVSRVENGESAEIRGLELQWKKEATDVLFFDTASVELAYTFSDSSALVATRPDDELPTPERSDHLLKASFKTKAGKLSTQIDVTYQSEALDDLGESIEQDKYREGYINLVIRNRYAINDTISFNVDLANITDTPERSYEGSEIRVSRNQYSSWFGSVGVTKTF